MTITSVLLIALLVCLLGKEELKTSAGRPSGENNFVLNMCAGLGRSKKNPLLALIGVDRSQADCNSSKLNSVSS